MSDRFLVLHGLALKKLGTAEAVADTLGLPEPEVREVLEAAVNEGQAVAARGAFLLTPAGRETLEREAPERFRALREEAAFADAAERFELVNRELKAVITDWQTLPVAGERVPNDHSDADYDRRVIDRLGDVHERVEGVLARLASYCPRLARYTDRLQAALERAEDGEIDYVSAPKIDSYHTIWFDLHEDLLRIQGRARDE